MLVMRFYCRVGAVLGVAFLTAGVALGQGFPGRGGGGGINPNPASLVQSKAVQKELKLTDDQLKKVDEAIQKALASSLDPDQMKRLNQISLQLRGVRAFTDARIQDELKMSSEQKGKIKEIVEASAKELEGLKGREGFQKAAAVRKETMEKVTGVLTAEQRKQWQEMTGAEFRMQRGPGLQKGRKNAVEAQ
jgi:hypothetical protein